MNKLSKTPLRFLICRVLTNFDEIWPHVWHLSLKIRGPGFDSRPGHITDWPGGFPLNFFENAILKVLKVKHTKILLEILKIWTKSLVVIPHRHIFVDLTLNSA